MDTVIVASSQFYSHYPKRIPQGTVNAEAVLIRLDSEWDGLTVRIHWLNVASGVEKVVLLERDQPNTIPWEVLTDLGELRMGLDGVDGGTVVKPTVWLTYGYVVDGVDPESGSDPQPPTPSWEQQMVEQATQANQAAQEAKEAAKNAADSLASAGPYAQAAKDAAEAAKASQDASATSARQANEAAQTAQKAATQAGEYLATVKEDANNAESAALEAGKSQEAARDAAQEAANARDQANTAATSADTAKNAAEQAATTAGAAQSGAAQSAQAAANSAQAAERAKQEAQNAAAAFPAPSPEFAGMVPVVNPEGDGYVFGKAGSGGACGDLLLAEYVHTGNQEIHFASFDWGTGIGECVEPHGLTGNKIVLLVPNEWYTANGLNSNGTSAPMEWVLYAKQLIAVPVDEMHIKIMGGSGPSSATDEIPVDPLETGNEKLDITKFHFEIPVGTTITNFPVNPTSLLVRIRTFTNAISYRYVTTAARDSLGRVVNAYNKKLGIPAFGSVKKPKHSIYHIMDMEVDILNSYFVLYKVNTVSAGRRGSERYDTESSGSAPTSSGRENTIGYWSEVRDGEIQYFTSVSLLPASAWISNGSTIWVYAKAVKQE